MAAWGLGNRLERVGSRSLRWLWAPNICALHQRRGAAVTRERAAARETSRARGIAMPVCWQIDHATWTVVVTAEGTLGLKDFEGLLDSMARVGTLSYRKLFDMTRISPALGKEDLIAVRG